MSRFLKHFKKDKKSETGLISINTLTPDVKLDIVNSMHQIMALSVSNVAKTYPKQFSMIKVIMTEYAFLIEHILVFRQTGNPQELFKKLQEFLIRSIEGYLEKYEDEEVVDEEKPVKDFIVSGLIDVEEKISENEGLLEKKEVPTSVSSTKPSEDWSIKPLITKRGGLPKISTPIENLKGIGEETATKFKEIGVHTLEDYVEYQKAQSSKQTDEDIEENENEE